MISHIAILYIGRKYDTIEIYIYTHTLGSLVKYTKTEEYRPS